MTISMPPQHLIEDSFLLFLEHNGIKPLYSLSLILDGKIHRFPVEGDDSSEKSGAYCIYTDHWPIGWARNWRGGDTASWVFASKEQSKEEIDYLNSPDFKARVASAQKKMNENVKAVQDHAAGLCRTRIVQFNDAPENHPYLKKKNVFPYGVKLDDGNGALAVPIRNINGDIRSLQWIFPDGKKKLYPEAGTKGCFWSVGLDTINPDDKETILLGEGFATMSKIYELTSLPSVAAISCNGFLQVAQALHEKFPKAHIIVMADNDKKTEVKQGFNPGIKHAQSIVDLKLAVGIITPNFPNNDGTDWDDYSLLHGDDDTAILLRNEINKILLLASMPPAVLRIKDRVSSINAQALRYKVFPPLKWAVEGFLPAGLSILAGGPKVGKSILALHLAVGVAIGGCVLGRINVQKGEVLYLALEDTERRLQNRINFGPFADIHDDMSALTIITEIPRQHEGGLDYIRWWLSHHQDTRLVIIDTLQMFRKKLSGKGSMYSEDYDVISEIKKLADEFQVAFLIIHHLKKGLETDWLSEISGSQGISGAADTIFSLKRERNSNMATFHRTGRDVEEKDFIMKLDGYGWTLMGEAEEFTMPEWKSQILAFLKEHISITPMQLAESANISHDAAKKNLQRLAKEGVIKKTGWGTYGLPEE